MKKKSILYHIYHHPAGYPFLCILRMRWFSRMMGWIFHTRYSRVLIAPLSLLYKIERSTYVTPYGGFLTLNDFFIRKSRTDMRRFPSIERLWSPADGCVEIFQNITPWDTFCIKGYEVDLHKVFWPKIVDFVGGDVCFIRLRFSDYHRFHFFDDCQIGTSVSRKWPLYSVDNDVLDTGLWVDNKSHCMWLLTKNFWEVLCVEFWATNVGSITNHKTVWEKAMRGEEKGYFSLGGSAMLLVFSKNTVHWREDIQSASAYHEETQVMTGEVIGKLIPALFPSENIGASIWGKT